VTTAGLLLRALHDTGDPPLRPLPDRVAQLLWNLGAPPRLAAHLRAVHDVAYQLTMAKQPARRPVTGRAKSGSISARTRRGSGRTPAASPDDIEMRFLWHTPTELKPFHT
jgi:hypothetical protein